VTSAGKVAWTDLPAPVAAVAGSGVGGAPMSTVERAVAEIWADVLGVHHVGVEDDFFALGGHSLLAFGVVAGVRERLGVSVPLKTLFEATTLRSLAERIEVDLWFAGEPRGERASGVI
jgi:acyl carrier protein